MNKVIPRMFTVLLLSVVFARLACAAEVPRMWKVTGTASSGAPLEFYILGITDSGLASEYGDYLSKKVLPVSSGMKIRELTSKEVKMVSGGSVSCAPKMTARSTANGASAQSTSLVCEFANGVHQTTTILEPILADGSVNSILHIQIEYPDRSSRDIVANPAVNGGKPVIAVTDSRGHQVGSVGDSLLDRQRLPGTV